MKIKDSLRAQVDLIHADKFSIGGACPECMQCGMRHLSEMNDHSIMRCNMQTAMNDEFNHKFENAQPEDML